MPSWVPDWTRNSPASLLARVEMLEGTSKPCFLSLYKRPLLTQTTLNYPLNCVLQATGWRIGTVWTDRWMYGDTLVASKTASSVGVIRGGNMHGVHTYSRDCGWHWLHDSPQNTSKIVCKARLDFWEQILSVYRGILP